MHGGAGFCFFMEHKLYIRLLMNESNFCLKNVLNKIYIPVSPKRKMLRNCGSLQLDKLVRQSQGETEYALNISMHLIICQMYEVGQH